MADGKKGSVYPPEHGARCAGMATDGTQAVSGPAKGPGVNEETPGGRVADRKRELGVSGTARLKQAAPKPDPELVAARKQIAQLEKENAFSRSAAAWFAKGCL